MALHPVFCVSFFFAHQFRCEWICVFFASLTLLCYWFTFESKREIEMRQKSVLFARSLPLYTFILYCVDTEMFCGQINDMKGIQWQRRRSSSRGDTILPLQQYPNRQQKRTKGALIKQRDTYTRQKKHGNVQNIPHPNLNLSIYSEIICLLQGFVSIHTYAFFCTVAQLSVWVCLFWKLKLRTKYDNL